MHEKHYLVCNACANGRNINIEYKSGPGSIKSETIKKQFIERDLFNANSLTEIQWRMKNTNLTKEKLVEWLTENKAGIESLGYEKINELFGTSFNNFTSKNILSNTVIEYFSSINNYNKIFK
ncbi:hypothetical protein [Flavobacterium oreochromis]|uniref:Uncharacterized protein n=1 Tax=Flavobacterium columnare TaxID=996 RepID=A0A246G6Y9_9FLAO|nr:hypothetical protein [Flavobacterium oreochromis]OWP74013.1 hypothetical protein BWK62_15270 [Flavobacterium oreochromis]